MHIMMNRKLPPLNALKAFEALGRHGRMTLAAEELGITHGAVSRQVRHLEAVLGISLFQGPKTRQELTDPGRRLLASLTAAFDLIDSGVANAAAEPQPALTVSCLATFSLRWLIPRLYRWKRLHPELEVGLMASDGPPRFTSRGPNLAIRVGQPPWPDGLVATAFLDDAVGPVLSPALVGAAGLARPEDLAALPRLHTATRRRAWDDWLASVGCGPLAPAASQTFEHFYFLLEAATAGLGVAIGSWPLVADDIKAGRLIAPFGFRPNGLSYSALRPRRADRASVGFIDWLVAQGKSTARPDEIVEGPPAAV